LNIRLPIKVNIKRFPSFPALGNVNNFSFFSEKFDTYKGTESFRDRFDVDRFFICKGMFSNDVDNCRPQNKRKKKEKNKKEKKAKKGKRKKAKR
jgi:hypothetical protein